MIPNREEIDVLLVSRDEMSSLAGLPWAEATAGRELTRTVYWSRENLPLDHAMLRKVDGRAFLYLQNW